MNLRALTTPIARLPSQAPPEHARAIALRNLERARGVVNGIAARNTARGRATRQRISNALATSPMPVADVAKAAGISKPAAHKHLQRMMAEGEILRVRGRGYASHYTLVPGGAR